MEEAAYKRLHSAWISSNTGTTMEEPFMASLAFPLSVVLASQWVGRFSNCVFLREFMILVVPITINLTALSQSVYVIPSIIAIANALICLYQIKTMGRLWQILKLPVEKRAQWVTNFRAYTYLLTIICILAVDLNVFPRKFAKTETYGFGGMDLGVGMFVICHGLVHNNPRVSDERYNIFSLFALGLIRLISIKIIGYQEHVTEYGVHWNFFFTLAFCRSIVMAINQFIAVKNFALLALASGLVHHTILTSGGQDWVLGVKPRLTLWDANREGLISTFGYVTLYYAAVSYKHYIAVGPARAAVVKGTITAAALWLATVSSSQWLGVSRRLCNLGYITWTCAVAASLGTVFLCIDLLLQCMGSPRVPNILHVINSRGLLFFLLGNVMTGVINMSLQTLLLSTVESYCILFMYVLSVTLLTCVMHNYIRNK